MTHEKKIEIRWRDVDAYQHVNNAVYATYLEECCDEWLERALGDAGESLRVRPRTRPHSVGIGTDGNFVLARVAIDCRREFRQEHGEVVVSCRLERIGTSSLALREEIRARDGALSAESEAVIVAWDRENGGSRPLTDAERSAFERTL